MKIDEINHFAFIGFPLDTDPYDNCTLIKEYCFDHLTDFNLQVLGYSQHMENGELVRAVGVEFQAAQRDALDVKIFELRDVWCCKKRQLSTITGIELRIYLCGHLCLSPDHCQELPHRSRILS